MVEDESHLKLLPASILDIYKVFKHIDMLSIDILCSSLKQLSTQLGSDLGALGHLCGVKMMSLCHG
jgi:hypothetical protein